MKKHYGLYLDDRDPDDAQMIVYLDRYVLTRRVGETLRQAVRSYMHGGSVSQPPAPRVQPTPQEMQGYLQPPTGATASAADKVKRAFFK